MAILIKTPGYLLVRLPRFVHLVDSSLIKLLFLSFEFLNRLTKMVVLFDYLMQRTLRRLANVLILETAVWVLCVDDSSVRNA